jgi:AbiV family abortive infection protein
MLINKNYLEDLLSNSLRAHYTRGKELAIQNSYRLMNRALLMKNQGDYGLAQSLTLLAYEEAQKAVYCSMVAVGLISEKDAELVFIKHEPKIILFDKLFSDKVIITNNQIRFNADKTDIAQIILNAKNEVTKDHNSKKNAGFYVNHVNGGWDSPNDIHESDIEQLVKEYHERIVILHLASEIFLQPEYNTMEEIHGFTATTYAKTDGSIGATIAFSSKTKEIP